MFALYTATAAGSDPSQFNIGEWVWVLMSAIKCEGCCCPYTDRCDMNDDVLRKVILTATIVY